MSAGMEAVNERLAEGGSAWRVAAAQVEERSRDLLDRSEGDEKLAASRHIARLSKLEELSLAAREQREERLAEVRFWRKIDAAVGVVGMAAAAGTAGKLKLPARFSWVPAAAFAAHGAYSQVTAADKESQRYDWHESKKQRLVHQKAAVLTALERELEEAGR